MKTSLTVAPVLVAILFGCMPACAEQGKDKPADDLKPKVLATVGKTEITDEKINTILSQYAGLTGDQLASMRERVLGQLIQRELISAYLKTVPCPADKLAETKKKLIDRLKAYKMTLKEFLAERGLTEADLRANVAMEALQAKAVSKEKADALVKSAPVAYFDGTTLNASHILIMSPPYASQADKAKARQKLSDLAKQIKAGTVTFESAAKKHSACPSGKDGGALGQAFTFDVMDPAFSKAAFALKLNTVSGIVESSFGFHLIKVTKRAAGTGKGGPKARAGASRILMTGLQADIIRKSVAANPVVIK